MIKKLVVLALVAAGLYYCYKYFAADTMEGFFNKKKGKVDFLQTNFSDPSEKAR